MFIVQFGRNSVLEISTNAAEQNVSIVNIGAGKALSFLRVAVKYDLRFYSTHWNFESK
jgi:hypothetical protein